MADFKNGIQIDINLTPEKQLLQELQSTMETLKKEANLELNIDTSNIISNLKELDKTIATLNKSLSKVDMSGMSADNVTQTAKEMSKLNKVFSDFVSNAGIESGEEFAAKFKQQFLSGLADGDIKNVLKSALSFNKEMIDKNNLTETTAEFKNIQNFLREIGVLMESTSKKAKGAIVSARKSLNLTGVLDKKEIQELADQFGGIWRLSAKGINIDKNIGEWVDIAKKHMIELSGKSADAAYQLAEVVKTYRDYQNGIKSIDVEVFPLSDSDIQQMETRIAKAYNTMLGDVEKLGYAISENNKATTEEYPLLVQATKELKQQETVIEDLVAGNKGIVKSVQATQDAYGNTYKLVETIETSAGNTTQFIQTLNAETEELETSMMKVTSNKEKEANILKEIDKLTGDILLKSTELRDRGFIGTSALDQVSGQLADIEKMIPSSKKVAALKELQSYLKDLSIEDKNLTKAENQFLNLSKQSDLLVQDFTKLQRKFADVITDNNISDLQKYNDKLMELASLSERAGMGEKLEPNTIKAVTNEINVMGKALKDSLAVAQKEFDKNISATEQFEKKIKYLTDTLNDAIKNKILDKDSLKSIQIDLGKITFDNQDGLDSLTETIDNLYKAEGQFLDLSKKGEQLSAVLKGLRKDFANILTPDSRAEINAYAKEISKLKKLTSKASSGEALDSHVIQQQLDKIDLMGSTLKKNLADAQQEFKKNTTEAEKFDKKLRALKNTVDESFSKGIINTNVLDRFSKHLDKATFDKPGRLPSVEPLINQLKQAEAQYLDFDKVIKEAEYNLEKLEKQFKDVYAATKTDNLKEYISTIKELKKLRTSATHGNIVDGDSIKELKNALSLSGKRFGDDLTSSQGMYDSIAKIKQVSKNSQDELDILSTKFNNVIGSAAKTELANYTKAMSELDTIVNNFVQGKNIKSTAIDKALQNMTDSSKALKNALTQANDEFLKNEKMEDGIKRLQKDLGNLGNYLDVDFINNLQNRINSITTDNAKEEIKALTNEISNAKTTEGQIRQLQNRIEDMESVVKKADKSLSKLADDKVQSNVTEYMSKIAELKSILNTLTTGGKALNTNEFADMKDDISSMTNEMNKSIKSLEDLIALKKKLNSDISTVGSRGIYNTDSIAELQNRFNRFTTDTAEAEIDSVTEAIKRMSGNVKQLDSAKDKFASIFNSGLLNDNVAKELQKQFNSLNTDTSQAEIDMLIKKVNTLHKELQPLIKLYDTLSAKLEVAKGRFRDLVGDQEIQEVARLESELNNLKNTIMSLGLNDHVDVSQITRDMESARQAAKEMDGALRGLSTTNENVFSNMFASVKNYALMYMGLQDMIGYMKQGVAHVVEVEDAMANLKRVADITEAEADRIQKSIGESAFAIASETQTLVDAVTIFSKLGYEIADAQEMAIATQKYDFAADINNIETSANSLVATLKGFGLDALGGDISQELIKVGDAINQVANNFALSANDVNEILQKSSAALSTFNNSVNESIALGTVAQEIMQDASAVGTALKSTAARLTTNANALSALESLGVSIKDGNEQLKSTYQILFEVGKAWETVESSVDKASYANDLFGKNHISTMLAIVENYDRLDEVMSSLSMAQGSVQAEFDTRMETTSAKWTQLVQAINQAWEQAISTEGMHRFLELLTKIVQTFGNVPSVIALATGALVTFKGKAIADSIDGLGKMFSSLKNVGSVIANLPSAWATASSAMAGATGIVGKLTAAFTALNLSTGGVMLAIGAITAVVMAGASAWKSYQDRFTNAIENINAQLTDIQNLETQRDNIVDISVKLNSDKIDTSEKERLVELNNQLAQQYPELVSGYDAELGIFEIQAEKIGDLITQKKELAAIETGNTLEGLTNEIEKYENKIEDTKRNIEITANYMNELANSGDRALAQSQLQSQQESLVKYQEKLQELQGQELQSVKVINDLIQSYREQDMTLEEAKQKVSELGIEIGIVDLAYSKASSRMAGSSTKIAQAITDATNKTDAMRYAIQALNNEQLDDNVIAALAERFPEIENNIGSATAAIEQFKKELGAAADEGEELGSKLYESLEDATTAYADATSTLDTLHGYLQELNKEQALTPALVNSIATAYPEIGVAITDVGATIDFLNQKIEEQVDVQAQAFEAMIGYDEKFYQDRIANNQDFQRAYENLLNAFVTEGQEAYKIDLGNYRNLNQLKEDTMNNLGKAVETWLRQFVGSSADGYAQDFANFKSFADAKASILSKLNGELKKIQANLQGAVNYAAQGLTGSGQNLVYEHMSIAKAEALEKQAKELTFAIQEVELSFDGINGQLNQYSGGSISTGGLTYGGGSSSGGSGSKGSSGKSAAEKAAEEAQKWKEKIDELNATFEADRYFEYNRALEEINNELERMETARELVTEGSIEHSAMLQQEIEILNQKRDAMLALNQEQHREAQELQEYLSKYQFYFDSEGKLINHQQRLLEIQKTTNAMSGSTEEAYNKKKEYVEWVKELEEKTARYLELMQTEIPKSSNEWNQLANEIKNVQKTIEEAHTSLVKDLRDQLADALMAQSKDLEDAIKEAEEREQEALEEEYNKKVAALQERIKRLKQELKDLDDTETDKRKKLAALEEEVNMWKKDDSVFAKKMIAELEEQIAQLKKEIKKDEINAEIDRLEEEQAAEKEKLESDLEDLKNKSEKEIEELKNKHQILLGEKEAYAQADKLIQQNHQEEIIKLLTTYSDTYKDVGTLLGKNFAEAFTAQVKEGMDAFNALVGGTASGATGSGATGGNTSSAGGDNSEPAFDNTIRKGDHVWVEDGANTQLYTDATGTVTKGSLWSNGIASADKLQVGGYGNGFWEILDLNGKSLGWVKKYQVRKWYDDTAQFAKGGRTPDNIDDGALAVLHSNEAILNANDTQKLDDIHNTVKEQGALALALSKLPTLITGMFDTAKDYLSNLHMLQQDAITKTMSMVNPIDINGLLDSGDTINTNNTENKAVNIKNEINVTNNTKNDSNFNARSLDKMLRKQASRFR